MATFTVRTMRAVGIVICLIAVLSFLLFALNQTSTASGHQQEELSGRTATTQAHESGFRKGVDEVAEHASAPVSGLSTSEWGEHALRLLFALIVFGFGLGYLARVVRVRV